MTKFATYVIQFPKDQDAIAKITNGIRALVQEQGGEITALSNEDEMTILDMIENHEDFPHHVSDEARAQAKALCLELNRSGSSE